MSRGRQGAGRLADAAAREAILRELDRNVLVEASAGTGKTAALVGRMVELLAEGCCVTATLAAVTFTRKAAAELRSRFQAALEAAARDEADEVRRERLQDGADTVSAAFMGTIHSFCGRLLRERPVEAGVDPAFVEVDDAADELLRQRAWELWEAQAPADEEGARALRRLAHVGLTLSDLRDAFSVVAGYPDVTDWPRAPVEPPDTDVGAAALRGLAAGWGDLPETFPGERGEDQAMGAVEAFLRHMRHARLGDPVEVAGLMERFEKVPAMRKGEWPSMDTARKVEAAWAGFGRVTAAPWLARWRAHCYAPVMDAVLPAMDMYDELREAAGVLNFEDLLMRAAQLLRQGGPALRAWAAGRWTHLLVDEFQDTDPVQAEVLLLLAADDPAETDWRRCRPRPGSLFVVGDPKQSIYRFRRADIATYDMVRRLVEEADGRVVTLSTNFRTVPSILTRVDGFFGERFPGERTPQAPPYVPFSTVRDGCVTADWSGVLRLTPPEGVDHKEGVTAWESRAIAALIRRAVEQGETVGRKGADGEEARPARPGDFLVITRTREDLASYGAALTAAGLPCRVTGGSLLAQVEELDLLCRLLACLARPDDAVAFVNVLRSPFVGLDDRSILTLRRAGGRFIWNAPVPSGAPAEVASVLADVAERFARYARWLADLPAVVAVERVLVDSGLWAKAAAGPHGDRSVGGLGVVLELLRSGAADSWSLTRALEVLKNLADGSLSHDGAPAVAPAEDCVRVMNLHKAKGLEAPVVFLAGYGGTWRSDAAVHVDRTGAEAAGWLLVTRPRGEWQRDVLAHPAQWDELSEREASFLEAENVRLQYVAATRAGSCLVVLSPVKGQRSTSGWKVLAPLAADAPELAPPDADLAAGGPRPPLDGSSPLTVASDSGRQWERAREATYGTVAAKAAVVHEPLPEEPSRAGEEPAGAEASLDGETLGRTAEEACRWGTAIHSLLEKLVVAGGAGLDQAAVEAVVAEGFRPEEAGRAADVGRAVLASELWRRISEAESVLAEVPFEMLDPRPGTVSPQQEQVMRGVIDLVVREPAGWVVVDWKTDRLGEGGARALVEKYRPQLEAYRLAWERATGEPVVEAGLFLTETGTFEVL